MHTIVHKPRRRISFYSTPRSTHLAFVIIDSCGALFSRSCLRRIRYTVLFILLCKSDISSLRMCGWIVISTVPTKLSSARSPRPLRGVGGVILFPLVSNPWSFNDCRNAARSRRINHVRTTRLYAIKCCADTLHHNESRSRLAYMKAIFGYTGLVGAPRYRDATGGMICRGLYLSENSLDCMALSCLWRRHRINVFFGRCPEK